MTRITRKHTMRIKTPTVRHLLPLALLAILTAGVAAPAAAQRGAADPATLAGADLDRLEAMRQVEEFMALSPGERAELRARAKAARASVPLKQAGPTVTCLPTCEVDDGKFLAIAGDGLVTLSDTVLDVTLTAEAGTTSFDVGIFDGDSGEIQPSTSESRWDRGPAIAFEYSLFASPPGGSEVQLDLNVSPAAPSALCPGPLPDSACAYASSLMPNDDWIDFVIDSSGPEADAPSGIKAYRLEARQLVPASSTSNAFKVRTTGQVTIRLGEQPFAYRASYGDITDLAILFPGAAFTTTPTTYDGVWSFFFDVSTDQTDLIVWDGDLDRGTFNGDRTCSPQPQCLIDGGQDTDDADTLNSPFVPLFPITLDVLSEGVADGFDGTTGQPSDDLQPFNSGIFVRAPEVRYDLIFPDGRVFGNENPSGNQEWEQFIVSARAGCDSSPACIPDCDPSNPIDPSCPSTATDPVGLPCADVCLAPGSAAAAIPRGLFEVRIEGNDLLNLNALRLPQIVCVDDLGQACVPLRGLLLGDTVFRDDSGDGVQQTPAEPGINGVIVNVRGTGGNLVGTTTTATDPQDPLSDGFYRFAVDQGTYTVEVAAENFAPAPSPGGSVGDRVWLDLNGDGLESAGEPGIAGVKLNLFEVGTDTSPGTLDDVFSGSTQSGGNGNYAFTDLAPGTYYVSVVDASVPSALSLFGGTDPSATRTITASEAYVDLDFGYGNATAVVGDYVWSDADGDGVQDPGESGIGGVTLDLIDAADTVVATATTKTDGSYLFADVAPGSYTVAVTDTAGALVVAGYTLSASADFPAPTDSTVVVAGGGAFLSADFGYNNPSAGLGSITDLVYLDNDFSGTFTPGDVPLDGASVSLVKENCAPTFFVCFGELLATDVSGNDGVPGEVSFPDLPAGNYALKVTQLPPGSFGSSSAAAFNGFHDVTLAAGGAAVGTNFGYMVPDGAVTVGDRVWLDIDGDGIEDPGEPGLANVHVQLFEVGGDGLPGTVDDLFISVAWTDRDGYYLFNNLFPGTWFTDVVAETVPAGLVPSANFTDPSATRTLAAGGAALDLDYPYTNLTTLVGDFLWIDGNDDGVQDPGEPGIGGVTLTLTDLNNPVDPLDDVVVATTETRSDGFYLFSAAAGDYTISVDPATVPGGLELGTNSPNPETTAPFTVPLLPDPLIKDFAYVNEAGVSLYSISDVVWFDPDHSGTFDGGESGIAGVTVDLLDARGGVVLSTLTDSGGAFSFSGLLEGEYTLVISDRGGVLSGGYAPAPVSLLPTTPPAAAGSLDVEIVDADVAGINFGYNDQGALTGFTGTTIKDPVGNTEEQIDTLVDDNVLDYDFGYQPPGSIGDRVWLDVNGDGDDESGAEPGIENVTLRLLDGAGNPVLDGIGNPITAVTDSDGRYLFELLPAGDYQVEVDLSTLPPDLGQTFEKDGTLDGNTPQSIEPGEEILDVDFGYVPLCDLTVEKTCQVLPIPGPFDCSDAKPLDVLTMIWKGTATVDVKAWKGSVGSTLLDTVTGVMPDDEVQVSGFAGAPNDVYWEIFVAGTPTKLGESNFHLSCSDDAMDGDEDCGQPLGDGKNDDSGLINDWLLEGLAGNGHELDCTPTPPVPAEMCEVLAVPTPSCEDGNPDTLTWRYTGGGCSASDNTQEPGKHICTETVPGIDEGLPITVTDKDGNPAVLSPGEEVTFDRSKSGEITLTQGAASEDHVIHVSCSQPLVAGEVFGSLTLMALDGRRDGTPVTYTYTVINDGIGVTGVEVFDDKLGLIAPLFDLAGGATEVFSVTADIAVPTLNRVDVAGDPISGGDQCTAHDEAFVDVTGLCEPSSEGALNLKDKEAKWQVTNNGAIDLVIERITITWPAGNGNLDEIKRDGDAVHKGDFPPPSAVIDSGWEGGVNKRTIKAGESDELKFKFKHDVSTAQGDYQIVVEFAQGCSLEFVPPPPPIPGCEDFECSKPIDALFMIWDGGEAVRVRAWKGQIGSQLLADLDGVAIGQEVQVSGYAGSPNDVFWEVFEAGTEDKIGDSKFHLSCSDDDMDGFEDVGKRQGDGKSNEAGLINDWVFEGLVDSDQTLDCNPDSGPAVGGTCVRVSQSSDDVEERGDGYMYFDSSDLELVDDSDYNGLQLVGMRFQNLAIPQGATITSSFIEFETDETDDVGTSLVFEGEDVDDAGPFAASAFHLSGRHTAGATSASVAWSPVPWLTMDEKHQTPDLSAIVEEIVGRPGWTSGNSMVFTVEGSGERTAEAYDGESDNAPLLCASFADGAPPQPLSTCEEIFDEAVAAGGPWTGHFCAESCDVPAGESSDCGAVGQTCCLEIFVGPPV